MAKVLLFLFLILYTHNISFAEESIEVLKKELEIVTLKKQINDVKNSISEPKNSLDKKINNTDKLLDAELNVVKAKHNLKREEIKFDIFNSDLHKRFSFSIFYTGSSAINIGSVLNKNSGGGLSVSAMLFKPATWFDLSLESEYRYLNNKNSQMSSQNPDYYNYYYNYYYSTTTHTQTNLNHFTAMTLKPTITLFDSFFNRSSLKVYGKIGVGLLFGNQTITTTNPYNYNYYDYNNNYSQSINDTIFKINAVYGGGVEIQFNENFGLNAEYLVMSLPSSLNIGKTLHMASIGFKFYF